MAAQEPIFVINGFYMSMREKFTKADAKLHYMVVEFDADTLSWGDFRGKVLGATDPAEAAEGSLRRLVLDQWKELGLASEPNVGDNGVHASASPFEAMSERNNWLGVSLDDDEFAQTMIQKAGIPKETVEAWCKDPQVDIGGGKKGSLFDQLEDMNSTECLAKAAALAGVEGVAALPKNTAFVFIKPHAVTDATVVAVKAGFEKHGIKILTEGVLDGPTIGSKMLIDNHYYAIAVKASLTKPADLNPPEEKQNDFKEKFGLSWPDALAAGRVFNALDGCTKLAIDGDQMDTQWAKTKKKGDLVKFGGGFYAGLVDPAA